MAVALAVVVSGCAPGQMGTGHGRPVGLPPQYAQLPPEDTIGTDVAPVETVDIAVDETNDPLEPVNRVIFEINDAIDTVLIRPVTVAYRTIVPEPIRQNVTNVLRNLRQPVIFANEMMQGDWQGAQVALTRFFLNTTIGLGGLMDIAGADKGLEFRSEDFGQTLAVWGVPEGPYLVLPLLGPSNVRDTTGIVVDSFIDPFGYVTGAIGADEATYYRFGATLIDTRSRTLEALDELEASSVDFYAALRSAYHQSREKAIHEDRAATPIVDIPVYDDFEGLDIQ